MTGVQTCVFRSTGTSGAAEEISKLLKNINDPHRHGSGKVIFSDEPKELVAGLFKLIEKEQKELKVDPPIGE